MSETIFQCEHCLRYFAPGAVGGAVLVSRPMGVLPEAGVCGLGDCAALREVVVGEVRRIDGAGQEAAAQSRLRACGKRKGQESRAGAVAALGGAAAALRSRVPESGRGSCPEERDDDQVHIGSSQEEFKARVDVSRALVLLEERLRECYGEWVPMVVLEQLEGCHMVHSRVADLRERLPRDEDVDQKSIMYEPTGRAHSHYRICRRGESERLKRKLKREDGQGTLTAVEASQ